MEQAGFRRNRIAIAGICLAALCAAAFLLSRGRAVDDTDPQDFRTVILFGNEDIQDRKVLKERVAAAAGRTAYRFEEKDGKIQLELKESLFRNIGTEMFLEYFLTKPVKVTLLRQTEGERYPDFQNPVCELQEGDIVQTQYGQGEKEAVPSSGEKRESRQGRESNENGEDEESRKYGENGENGESAEPEIPFLSLSMPQDRYFKLTFSEETASGIRQALGEGDQLILCCDWISQEGKTSRYTASLYDAMVPDQTDPASWSLYYSEDSPFSGHEDVFLYNLSHTSLREAYNYVVTDEIRWEDMQTTGISGEYLVNEQDLRDSYYLLQYSAIRSLTREEMSQMKQFLSMRLDALRLRHAIGETGGGALCVKAEAGGLSPGIARSLLIDSAPVLQVWTEWDTPSYSVCSFSHEKPSIELSMDPETAAWLKDRIRGDPSSGNIVYLLFGNGLAGEALPAASLKVPGSFDGEELVFEDFCCGVDSQEKENARIMLPLFEELYLNPVPPVNMTLDYYSYEDRSYLENQYFGLTDFRDKQEEELGEAIRKVCPGATLTTSYAYRENRLILSLHLDVNAALPGQFLSAAAQIWRAVDFENRPFTQMYILPRSLAADGYDGLYFKKGMDGAEHVTGFAPQLDESSLDGYGKEILKRLKNDAFYAGFADLNTRPGNGLTIPRK